MAPDVRPLPTPVVRPAHPGDVPTVLALIRELADYERALAQVQTTEGALSQALFGDSPVVHCHVALHEGKVGGFGLWFLNFSTWLGVPGIYLEDLYVQPALRGLGLGRSLLRTLAQVCVERGYGRLEWSVLDWNEPARGFYRSIGAREMDEWTVCRLSGEDLAAVANGSA